MKPPTMAPAMPNSIVMMKPPGSRPGVRSLAMKPTTNPNRIHARTDMLHPPGQASVASEAPRAHGRAGWGAGSETKGGGFEDGRRIRRGLACHGADAPGVPRRYARAGAWDAAAPARWPRPAAARTRK